jgi:general secretion pathway protein G
MKKCLLFFSIILVVIVLGIMLAATGFIVLSESPVKSKILYAKGVVNVIQEALTNYFQDNGVYPTTHQGLQALVTKPSTQPIPKNYSPNGYLVRLTYDPWGKPYQYTYQLVNGKHKITILSWGADGKLGGKGYNADIIGIFETEAK